MLVSTMRELDRRRLGEVHYVGLAAMIRQPEFSEVSLVQRGVEMLEDGDLVADLGSSIVPGDGVTVHIGDRTSRAPLRDYSVVMTGYDSGDGAGVLGVLGPNRMPYRRTIGAVQQVTEAVTGASTTAYG